MIEEESRGTANRFPGTRQPTGPLKPSHQPSVPREESYKYGNKPTKEVLFNIEVPDQYTPVNQWGEKVSTKNVFDAELNRDTQTLTLLVKIKFDFKDMYNKVHFIEKDGQIGFPVFVKLKDPQLWVNFKNRKERFIYQFANINETYWSYHYELVPVTDCKDPIKSYKTVLKVIPVTTGEHHICQAHMSKDVETGWNNQFNAVLPRNFIHPRYERDTKRIVVSEDDLVNFRLQDKNPFNTKQIFGRQHVIAVHEFGHAIGIAHINEKAFRERTGIDPYGDTLEQKSDIMGSGGIVGIPDMYPYLVAIKLLTGCEWEVKV